MILNEISALTCIISDALIFRQMNGTFSQAAEDIGILCKVGQMGFDGPYHFS